MGLWDRLTAALSVGRPRAVLPVAAATRIEYDRTPPVVWQAALDAQHVPGLSRLYVAWEPGDVWQPIHRWFLWQLQPMHGSHNDAIKAELRGPSPRSAGHYCAPSYCDCHPHSYGWKGGPCRLIDRQQWTIYRTVFAQTGEEVIPRRFWVIQGEDGGHPFQVGYGEMQARREAGLPPDVPSAGDLPYAEFDQRVLDAITAYDLLRHVHGAEDLTTKAGLATIRRMQQYEREGNTALWNRMTAMAEMRADEAGFYARKDGVHYHRWQPVGEKPAAVDQDAVRHEFIHDYDVEAVA